MASPLGKNRETKYCEFKQIAFSALIEKLENDRMLIMNATNTGVATVFGDPTHIPP